MNAVIVIYLTMPPFLKGGGGEGQLLSRSEKWFSELVENNIYKKIQLCKLFLKKKTSKMTFSVISWAVLPKKLRHFGGYFPFKIIMQRMKNIFALPSKNFIDIICDES